MRREDNYKNFEAGKKAILGKWRNFFEGKEILMGCSSCGGTVPMRPLPSAPPVGSSMAVTAPDGTSIIEFLGTSPSVTTYVGKKTGRQYRFGNEPNHKRMFVFNDDVPGFLAFNHLFRTIESVAQQPIAVASAAPKMETVAKPTVQQPSVQQVQAPPAPPAPAPTGPKPPPDSPEGKFLSLQEIRRNIEGMTTLQITLDRAKEVGGPNRKSVIKMYDERLADLNRKAKAAEAAAAVPSA